LLRDAAARSSATRETLRENIMQYRRMTMAALTVALAAGAALALAAPAKTDAAAKAGPADQVVQGKAKKPAPKKLVDINRASKAQLTRLDGVDDALAAKMIAGRPYRSKADLVTRDILPRGVYESVKADIVAKP
jgi:DNA uptake protein ComE-like DNA-binding protein